MTLDIKMLPMKIHYFIRFAGTGPLTSFLPVIARQKGVSEQTVGMIWTVLPFLSPVTKTSAGAIADCSKGHRAVFLGGIVVMLVALTGLYWTPDIPTHCFNATLIKPPGDFADLQNSTNSQKGSATSSSTTLDHLAKLHNGESGTSNTGGSVLSSYGENAASSNLSIELQEHELCSSLQGHIEYLSAGELAKRYEFWGLFACLLLQYCGHVVVITLQETVCFQMLGAAHHKYGQQRLWGTVGWGLSAMVSGALVDWYSKGLHKKDYWPAHVLTAAFLLTDLLVVGRLRFSVPDRKMTPAAIHGALWRPQVLLILASIVIIGSTCGMLWTFQFLLVEDVALLWDPDFPHLKLLLGLCQGVQCFLAEVPFFFMAGRIIQRFGHVNTLLMSLVGFALRLNLYSVITNPWWFLPADLLHGVSFGIAYPCLTSYASVVSPKGAAATVQGIFGAAFFGGTGLGALVGGRLFQDLGGRRAFLTVGVFSGVYALVFTATHALITRGRPGEPSNTVDTTPVCEEGVQERRAEETLRKDEERLEEEELKNGMTEEEAEDKEMEKL
nr:major facilitator superfamily domain-containing protein 6-like isoform X1 [Procambarus clarkii]XP_045602960.1 major facilitator superfamily domain-containing protein 6-like isoform X1 [Procambarus clarkii]XP_045602961.1 major facilitator superfamily domain-containing protein 6-like isoform X1 [Procambarus clarkii]XP_045602962.1 major facilitator superfamily domain-containing protein 6-like isoform X1 [Procambarus clarkii]XP_045602963.1 major facilitator superfamily domain-containing protein 